MARSVLTGTKIRISPGVKRPGGRGNGSVTKVPPPLPPIMPGGKPGPVGGIPGPGLPKPPAPPLHRPGPAKLPAPVRPRRPSPKVNPYPATDYHTTRARPGKH